VDTNAPIALHTQIQCEHEADKHSAPMKGKAAKNYAAPHSIARRPRVQSFNGMPKGKAPPWVMVIAMALRYRFFEIRNN